MTSEQPKRSRIPAETGERTTTLLCELRNVDVWTSSTPIHLAGCEEDQSEPHIFRGID